MSAAKAKPNVKPLDGQLSLLEGEPPVRYCRRCGRRLKSKRSQKHRLGPTCRRHEAKSESET